MVAGIAIVALILFMTVFPHVFTRFNPNDQNRRRPDDGSERAPTSWAPTTWAGTCGRGRVRSPDHPGVAIAAALVSALIGIPLGLLSGFAGGIFDRVLSLIMDSVYSFPGLILAIAFAAMLGPGVVNITLAVAVVYIPTYFRLVRGQTLSIKEEVYVEAARAIGARRATILEPLRVPQRHRHGGGGALPEHRGRHPDRGGALLHRPGAARGNPRLGHGPVHGKEVPSLGGLVDDHVPGPR